MSRLIYTNKKIKNKRNRREIKVVEEKKDKLQKKNYIKNCVYQDSHHFQLLDDLFVIL